MSFKICVVHRIIFNSFKRCAVRRILFGLSSYEKMIKVGCVGHIFIFSMQGIAEHYYRSCNYAQIYITIYTFLQELCIYGRCLVQLSYPRCHYMTTLRRNGKFLETVELKL